MSSMRGTAIVIAVYAVLVAGLISLRPLWLDEVLQLIGTKPARHGPEVVEYVPQNPGGVPLGYLVQWWWLKAAGVSRWSVRVPAAIFGVAACLLSALLARRLGLSRPWAAALVFAVLPLALRYSTEGRPYSQALALSLAATLLFLRMARGTTPMLTGIYAATLIGALYTQPFTLGIAGAHLLWAALRRDRTLARETALALGAAVLAFVPWYMYAHARWLQTNEAGDFRFAASWKTPLLFLREATGGGYWGAGVLAALCWLGARARGVPRENRLLLLLMIATPVAAGLAATAFFGYFVAIRHFVWILPPAAVLAAAAFDQRRDAAVVLVAGLAVVGAVKTWKYIGRAAEDWEAAAHVLRRSAADARCVETDQRDQAVLYEVFAPELEQRRCPAPPERGRMVLAVTPYAPADPGSLRGLLHAGFRVAAERRVGGTRIVTLER